jgi:hypothetical protein
VAEQIPVIGRVLNLWQIQECANDIKVEERRMITPLFTQSRRVSEMKAHRVNGRLNMRVTVHPFRDDARLAARLERDSLPFGLCLFYFWFAGIFRLRHAERGNQHHAS